MSSRKRVVIVGAGFAGIKAARNLENDSRFDITLISDRDCFEYHAALYRSATGRSRREVMVPLDKIFEDDSRVKIIRDRVSKLTPEAKMVVGERGQYEYDILILALGVVTSYYGIEGLADFSYGIKSVDEAMELKNHLHAELTSPEKPDLNYVIVGAGPTGIELAGELVFYLRHLRERHQVKKRFKVMLVEAAPRLLPNLPESISRTINQRLKALGIKIYTSTAVKAETADKLQLPEGTIDTHTVIWTAGVTNNPFFGINKQAFETGKAGKVVVDSLLQAKDNIYVLGDSALTSQTGWAQTALYDADFVTKNLRREASGLQPLTYTPSKPVGAIPVGPKWCAITSERRSYAGYRGWLTRRWMDLKLMTGLLPGNLAWRAWWSGNLIEETCPECR